MRVRGGQSTGQGAIFQSVICPSRPPIFLHNVMTAPYGARTIQGTGYHGPDAEAGEILMAISPVCSKCNLYVARNGYTCSQLICECVQGKRRKTTEELVKGREVAKARRVITQFLKSA